MPLALQEVYGEAPGTALPPTQLLPLPINRPEFVKAVAWSPAPQSEAVTRRRDLIDTSHPDLNWSTDGCFRPPGVDFGSSQTFRPARLVHDIGDHNLRVLERTPGNREQTDQAFYTNMETICDRRPPPECPSCSVVNFVYEEGVRIGSAALF